MHTVTRVYTLSILSLLLMRALTTRSKQVIGVMIGFLIVGFILSRGDSSFMPEKWRSNGLFGDDNYQTEEGTYYEADMAQAPMMDGGEMARKVMDSSLIGTMPSPMPPAGTANIDEVLRDERMIVRNAYQSAVVEDVQESVKALHELADRVSGFVVTSDISGLESNPSATVTMRFPAESFDTVIGFLHENSIRLVSESVNSEDVTEQYVDLEARLKNLEASEAQFLAIMNRATRIEDVLQVQQQLERVRGEIESVTGRMQYLERTSSLSTLTAYLSTEEEDLPVLDPTEKWSPLATVKAAIRELLFIGQGVLDAIIWAIIFLPVWGGALLGYNIWLRHRKK